MTDTTTEAEVIDISSIQENLQYNPLLKVFKHLLEPVKTLKDEKLTMQYCSRIIDNYSGIEFKDMENYNNQYVDYVLELLNILDEIIASDDECLNVTNEDEDLEHNRVNYLNLVLQWQIAMQQWSFDWDCLDKKAAIKLAAQNEAGLLAFGEKGLVGFFSSIQFNLTDDEQQTISDAVLESVG